MSAGARQAAIDALRKDEDVIVIEKSSWFRNLHSTIRHAATRKNYEDYLYDPLMEIFGTYTKTCSHEDFEATVIPQGCFELRTDSSTTVSRRLLDLLFVIHSIANPDDPKCSKSRLGGWVEGKPWVQPPKNPKKKGEDSADKQPDASGDNADGQDKEDSDIAKELEDIAEEGELVAQEGEVIAQESKVVVGGPDDERGAITVTVDEECEGVTEAVDIDEKDITKVWADAGENPVLFVEGPSIEDASALVLDPKEVIRRLVEDLPQLCQQAYFAFDHFAQDVIYAIITYGMTFSCFKFTRPANWESIRGNRTGTVGLPITIFSNERMVFKDWLNPHLLQALALMTASLGMSYQPSWFQLPSNYRDEEPDLAVAEEALKQYNRKINGKSTSSSPDSSLPTSNVPTSNVPTSNVPALSSPTSGSPASSSSSEDSSPAWVPTASEAAAPVGESGRDLRSGKGRSTASAPNLEPVAENEGIETPEPVLAQQNRPDAASSDTGNSPLTHRPQPDLAQPGHARQATDAPTISGVPATAGPSTKDTRNLASNAHTPAVKALASGVDLNAKFITPENRGKRISEVPRGKARQQKMIDIRAIANGPALPALLSTPTNDASTSDGLGGSGFRELEYLPTSQEAIKATGNDSRTGARSRAKSRKRKGRPSSPLRTDNFDPDPVGNSAPALAGPSKKRRLVSQADEQPVDDSAGGPSNISRIEASVSAHAAHVRDDAATERVFDPLTARERPRRSNTRVYQSRAASERRSRSGFKPVASTIETAVAIAGPAVPGRSRTHSTAGSSRTRVRCSPPPQRQDTTKSKRSRK